MQHLLDEIVGKAPYWFNHPTPCHTIFLNLEDAIDYPSLSTPNTNPLNELSYFIYIEDFFKL